jgi:formate dehydrogenase major subunit
MKQRTEYSQPLPRLETPLVRKEGELRPASWDEALNTVANGLRGILETDGPNAVGLFSCSKSTNEMNYAAQKFMRTAIGSNNIDSCNRT